MQFSHRKLVRLVALGVMLLALCLGSVLSVYAQVSTGGSGGVSTGGSGGVSTNGSGGGGSETLVNPIEAKDIVEFITQIIGVLLVFAVPIIVLYIMYAGYLFVTARGDESQISTAKSAITWAVIGGVIVLATELIIQIIKNTVLSLQ